MKKLDNGIALCITSAIILIAVAIILGIMDSKEEDKQMRGCEDIGGHYIVIDKTWSAATKTMINEYGCVKE